MVRRSTREESATPTREGHSLLAGSCWIHHQKSFPGETNGPFRLDVSEKPAGREKKPSRKAHMRIGHIKRLLDALRIAILCRF